MLRFYEFYSDDFFFYLVTEYCEGGDLLSLIIENGAITERQTAIIMRQILSAVEYCHGNNIVHRYNLYNPKGFETR